MRRLRVVIILILTGTILFLLFKIATGSTLSVEITNEIQHSETTVLIDGKPAILRGNDEGKIRYVAKVGAGNHTVDVRSAGYNSFTTTVSTGLRTNVTTVANLQAQTVESVVEALYKDSVVSNPRYFGGNSWGVFQLGEGDLILSIAKFNTQTGQWEIVEEGSDISPVDLKNKGAPEDLILYLRGTVQ